MISSVETALCTFDFAQLNPGVFQGFARVNLFFSLFLRMLFVFRIAYVLFVCCTLGWKKKFGQYHISIYKYGRGFNYDIYSALWAGPSVTAGSVR